jgi:hypothetical protein
MLLVIKKFTIFARKLFISNKYGKILSAGTILG